MKAVLLLATLTLASCAGTVPTVITTAASDVPAALATYQAALGAAEQAEQANPKSLPLASRRNPI